jgi:hypothetical protein
VSTVVFYISGHGFGHAVRQITIINALRQAAPEVRVIVRTTAPSWLFRRTGPADVTIVPGDTDTGVVQIDSLRPDERETIVRARAFQAGLRDRVREEAAMLRDAGASLVVADAPPLACAAAAEADIPAVVCANFTWDWIYREYSEQPGVDELVASLGESYAAAREAWRMPVHGGFETIERIIDIPFVARHARNVDRASVRTRLGLPLARPLALVSFGGYGLRQLPLDRLDCLREWDVVVTSPGEDRTMQSERREASEPQERSGAGGPRERLCKGVPGDEVPRIHHVREDFMYDGGLRYEDLVKAVDVVITKPGYGILSDCLANGTAMLFTPRGRFAEYDVMVREMPGLLRCRRIELDAFEDGRWLESLRDLSSTPAPAHPAKTDGAQVAAAMIADLVNAP